MSRQPSMMPSSLPSSSGTSPIQAASTNGSNQYQTQLLSVCGRNRWLTPNYELFSDRRGGRTAWSCSVTIPGQTLPPVRARFFYDGGYVNSAKEDAAQVMLQRLGMLPPTGAPQTQYQHQQQQQHQQSVPPPQQRRNYSSIGS